MKTGDRQDLTLRTHRKGETDSNQYGTPQEFFEVCNRIFGPFNLDVCARPDMTKCDRFFTAEDSCLNHRWYGKAWNNPPYSEGAIGPIIEHAWNEAREGRCSTLCLFPVKKSERVWFHGYVANAATLILPVEKRIRFLRNGIPTDSPNHASVLVWYRAGNVLGCPGYEGPRCHGWNQTIGVSDFAVVRWRQLGLL
jgi:phage N-6-adenine-methyltransferase